jgi:hypothetical protein
MSWTRLEQYPSGAMARTSDTGRTLVTFPVDSAVEQLHRFAGQCIRQTGNPSGRSHPDRFQHRVIYPDGYLQPIASASERIRSSRLVGRYLRGRKREINDRLAKALTNGPVCIAA